MLSSMDQNLLPLTTQLDAIADMNPPDLLSYPAWLTNEAGLKQRLQGKQGLCGEGCMGFLWDRREGRCRCVLPACASTPGRKLWMQDVGRLKIVPW